MHLKNAMKLRLIIALCLVTHSLSALTKLTYQELMELNLDKMNCDNPKKFDNIQEGLHEWQDALNMMQTGAIKNSMHDLMELRELARIGLADSHHAISFAQGAISLKLTMKHKVDNTAFVQTGARFGTTQYNNIRTQVERMLQTEDVQTRKECCSMMIGIIDLFIEDLEQIQSACLQMPITINIEGDIKRIEVIRQNCTRPVTPLPPDLTKNVTTTCIAGSPDIFNAGVSGQSVFQTDIDANFTQQYSTGYWMRFMVRYPEILKTYLDKPQYFISRLTRNKPFRYNEMGDRTLDVWLRQTHYIFATYDDQLNLSNVENSVPFTTIDGVWTFVYFSYSNKYKKSTAFLLPVGSDVVKFDFNVTHNLPQSLHFILGGSLLGTYPGFNGQFSRVLVKIGDGAYIGNVETLLDQVLICNPEPQSLCDKQKLIPVIQNITEVTDDGNRPSPYVSDMIFPTHYAVQGWFKWVPIQTTVWHSAFRLTINDDVTSFDERRLGDRTLNVQIDQNNQKYEFDTYSYQNLQGDGNAFIGQTIGTGDLLTQWHWISFGYSRHDKVAVGAIKLDQSPVKTVTFNQILHFMSDNLLFYVAKDLVYPSYSGYVAQVNLILCYFSPLQQLVIPNNPIETPRPPTPPPVSPKTPIHEIQPICVAGSPQMINAAYDRGFVTQTELTGDDLKDTIEYGYSYWMRFMTRFPSNMLQGKNQQYYFVSTLTSNRQPGVLGMGDRILSVHLGQGFYAFSTNDYSINSPAIKQNIQWSYNDIESVWTFLHFSYSHHLNQAYAIILFQGSSEQYVLFNVKHQDNYNYLKFLLGGNNFNGYPGFNGQFTRPAIKLGAGSHIDTVDEFYRFATSCNPQPQVDCNQKGIQNVISNVVEYSQNEIGPGTPTITNANYQFADQYAVSGWFKWIGPINNEYNNVFRFTSLLPDNTINQLGDRELALLLGKNTMVFSTYSYTDMNGNGNTNIAQTLTHGDRGNDNDSPVGQWHFIYFAYSRDARKVYALEYFQNNVRQELFFSNINHYLVSRHYFFIGKGPKYPTYNGRMSNISLSLCDGAFDLAYIPPFNPPVEPPVIPPRPQTPVGPSSECTVGAAGIGDSPYNGEPTIDQVADQTDMIDTTEYGYGFWARFLTRYPIPLVNGKSLPEYPLSQLQLNEQDKKRALSITLGDGNYIFRVYDKLLQNTVENREVYGDIEGVWTYFYIGYSSKINKAVGFLNFVTNTNIIQTSLNAVQDTPNYLRLIIGGKQNGNLGFNGQISKPIFRIGQGALISTVQSLQDFALSCNAMPTISCSTEQYLRVVEQPQDYTIGNNNVNSLISPVQAAFAEEQSVSGWFRWVPLGPQQEWHLAFRLTINDAINNRDNVNLGDIDLGGWLGKSGQYFFSTYSYNDLNGNGNPNNHQGIQLKNRESKWHYIYFAYSRPQKKAFVQIKWNDTTSDELNYININHYLSSQYYFYAAKDQFYPSYNGQIAYLKVHFCRGAFNTINYPVMPVDPIIPPGPPPVVPNITSPVSPNITVPPTVKPPPVKQCKMGSQVILDSAVNRNDSIYSYNATQTDLKYASEYGYGYWMRYLEHYPTPIYNGRNQPWYFLSKLTRDQKNVADTGVLTVLLGTFGYYFFTEDITSAQISVNRKLAMPDIEGIWTYVYYSYSLPQSQATAFIKYNGADPLTVTMNAKNAVPNFLLFTLGGSDYGKFPGFNGQFTQNFVNIGSGAYLGTLQDLQIFGLQCSPVPKLECTESSQVQIVNDSSAFTINNKPVMVRNKASSSFATEYATSGWFKYTPPVNYEMNSQWQLAFRVTINDETNNLNDQRMGDHELSAFIDGMQSRKYSFATYSRDNKEQQAGYAGRQLNVRDKAEQWHYIYFGYSFDQQTAVASITFNDQRVERVEIKGLKHFLAQWHYIYLGKDKFNQGFSGYIAHFRFISCSGSFNPYPEPNPPSIDVPTVPPPVTPVSPKTPPIQIQPTTCVTGQQGIMDSAFNQQNPIFEQELHQNDLPDTVEYGYGYWMRFLSRYPTALLQGKTAPFYFVSRLTNNNPNGDLGLGDRVLGVWQGQGAYFFITNDIVSSNPNVYKGLAYGDIEGIWTYVFYSYSKAQNIALAMVQYNGGDIKTVQISATHVLPTYLRFIVGGNSQNQYPGFNGQFSSPVLRVGQGAYLDTTEEFNKYTLSCNPKPQQDCKSQSIQHVTEANVQINPNTPYQKIKSLATVQFPEEYSVGGWFQWTVIEAQPLHSVFRLTINDEDFNKNDQMLGDRDLTVLVNPEELEYQFSTYSYSDLIGNGLSTITQIIPTNDLLPTWHYIYFGYSRTALQASGYVQFQDSRGQVTFPLMKHFLSNRFFIYTGRDAFYPAYSGHISHLRLFLCQGAYNPNFSPQPNVPDRPSPVSPKTPVTPIIAEPVTPICTQGPDQIVDAAYNKKAVANIPSNDFDDASEYGYGYWMQFLTRHPVPMVDGKSHAWYFVSRLTNNDDYSDIAMGDRVLLVLQGQGGYYFVTNDVKTNNPNVHGAISYNDIEGQWTYLYFSYSSKQKKAVAFLKFDDQIVQRQEFQVTHEIPTFLRFVLGGADLDIYPGFNGRFTRPVLAIGAGSYLGTEDFIHKYALACNPQPEPDCQEQGTLRVIKDEPEQLNNQTSDEAIDSPVEYDFANEYSVSGWFKFNSSNNTLLGWRTVIRLTINDPRINKNNLALGDRSLLIQLNTDVFSFSTYSYNDMNGLGNPNIVQTLPYRTSQVGASNEGGGAIEQWHFLYFGYSRTLRRAAGYVQFSNQNTKITTSFNGINHYLVKTLLMYIGQDSFYQAYIGQAAHVRLHLCNGAYDDSFPPEPIGPPELPSVPEPIGEKEKSLNCTQGSQTILDAGAQTVIDSQATTEQLKDVSEYGYGFWMRFLTRYPLPLLNGKKQTWYFVSRLTTNKPYGNTNFGDRVLALFQGQGGYYFITNDLKTQNPNLHRPIIYGDIEGDWQYVYFSYSASSQKAVGLLTSEDNHTTIRRVEFSVQHSVPSYLRLIIGGNDLGLMQGFNGQFAMATLRVGKGAFINDQTALLNQAMSCNPKPTIDCTVSRILQIVSGEQSFNQSTTKLNETFTNDDNPFPEKYSAQGWFLWDSNTQQQPIHSVFRITINNANDNQDYRLLGDRSLTVLLQGSQYQFSTYTYNDLNGQGQANLFQSLAHRYKQVQWHYIYFAYSRIDRRAYAQVQFSDSNNELNFPDTNHFLSKNLYIYAGKDRFYPSYTGWISHFRVTLCDDGFTITPKPPAQPEQPSPVIPTPPVVPPVGRQPTCISGSTGILNASFSGSAVVNSRLSGQDLQDTSEYGYGFWQRWLTRYPTNLIDGMTQPAYFISRLTCNDVFNNLGMGDRILVLLQGTTTISFATMDTNTRNPNLLKHIQTQDPEGVWTYIYFSYSRNLSLAVGMLQIPGQGVQKVEFPNIQHDVPSVFRFLLGGNNLNVYPGFNGQFFRPTFKVGNGAFLIDAGEFQSFAISCNPPPSEDCNKTTQMVPVESVSNFTLGDLQKAPVQSNMPFAPAYSVAGWFKWTPTTFASNWHVAFRVASTEPGSLTNADKLGDRDLAAWVGITEGNVYALATYTYTDMQGNGNSNLFQTTPYKDQLTNWHYIYFSYSRDQRNAYGYILFSDHKVDLNFNNINHYLVPKLYLYLGQDQFYHSFNGQIGHFIFRFCGDAYNPNQLPVPPTPTVPGSVIRTPKPPQPPPIIPPSTEKLCIDTLEYLEITHGNIASVLDQLRTLQSAYMSPQPPSNQMCYCTFPEDRGQVSLLQLSGPGVNITENDAYLIHQLLASNRLRLKL